MKKASSTAGSSALLADAPPASGGRAPASPYKSAVEELDTLRRTFRAASQHYAKRIDMEIIRIRERVVGAGEEQPAAGDAKSGAGQRRAYRDGADTGHLHDLRDMTTLLRTLEVKPLAGRRKDLKKIESLVDELRLLVERWR